MVDSTIKKPSLDLYDYLSVFKELKAQEDNRYAGNEQDSYHFAIADTRQPDIHSCDQESRTYIYTEVEAKLRGAGGRSLLLDVNPGQRNYQRFADSLEQRGYFKKTDLVFDVLTGLGRYSTDFDASQVEFPVKEGQVDRVYDIQFSHLFEDVISPDYIFEMVTSSNRVISFQHFFSLLPQASSEQKAAIATLMRHMLLYHCRGDVSYQEYCDKLLERGPINTLEELNRRMNDYAKTIDFGSVTTLNEFGCDVFVSMFLVLMCTGELSQNERGLFQEALQLFVQHKYNHDVEQVTNLWLAHEYDVSCVLDFLLKQNNTILNELVDFNEEEEMNFDEAVSLKGQSYSNDVHRVMVGFWQMLGGNEVNRAHNSYINDFDNMLNNFIMLCAGYGVSYNKEDIRRAAASDNVEEMMGLNLDPYLVGLFYEYYHGLLGLVRPGINNYLNAHIEWATYWKMNDLLESYSKTRFKVGFDAIIKRTENTDWQDYSWFFLLPSKTPFELFNDNPYYFELAEEDYTNPELINKLLKTDPVIPQDMQEKLGLNDGEVKQVNQKLKNNRDDFFVHLLLERRGELNQAYKEGYSLLSLMIEKVSQSSSMHPELLAQYDLWKDLVAWFPEEKENLFIAYSRFYATCTIKQLPRLESLWNQKIAPTDSVNMLGTYNSDATWAYIPYINEIMTGKKSEYTHMVPLISELTHAVRHRDSAKINLIVAEMNDQCFVPAGYAVIIEKIGPDRGLSYKVEHWGKYVFVPVKLVDMQPEIYSPDTGFIDSIFEEGLEELTLAGRKVKTHYFVLALDEFPGVFELLQQYTVGEFNSDDFMITPHVHSQSYLAQNNNQSFLGPKVNLDWINKRARQLEKIEEAFLGNEAYHMMDVLLEKTGTRSYADFYESLLSEVVAHENAHLLDPETCGTIDQEYFATLMGLACSYDPYVILFRHAEIFLEYETGGASAKLKELKIDSQGNMRYVIEQQHGRACAYFFEQVAREMGMIQTGETFLDVYTNQGALRLFEVVLAVNDKIVSWGADKVKQKAREYAYAYQKSLY